MTVAGLVILAGIFTVALGAWHVGVPRWFAFRAAILDRPEAAVRPLPPFRLGPVRHDTTPSDVLGIAWVMNAATSHALVTIGLVCLLAPAWIGTPVGRAFALWVAGWWGIRAALQLSFGRRRIDIVLLTLFASLTGLFVLVAAGAGA
jgi:hypothetical protein